MDCMIRARVSVGILVASMSLFLGMVFRDGEEAVAIMEGMLGGTILVVFFYGFPQRYRGIGVFPFVALSVMFFQTESAEGMGRVLFCAGALFQSALCWLVVKSERSRKRFD